MLGPLETLADAKLAYSRLTYDGLPSPSYIVFLARSLQEICSQ